MVKARERRSREDLYPWFPAGAVLAVLLCLFVQTVALGVKDTEAGGASPKAAPYERETQAAPGPQKLSPLQETSREGATGARHPAAADDLRQEQKGKGESADDGADDLLKGDTTVDDTGEAGGFKTLVVAADGPLRHVRPDDMRDGKRKPPVQASGLPVRDAGATPDGVRSGATTPENVESADADEGQQAGEVATSGRGTSAASASVPASGSASGAASGGSGVRLFGTIEFKGQLKALPKWSRVVDIERKKPGLYLDRALGGRGGQLWRDVRNEWQGLPLIEKLKKVNTFFNQWPYRLDSENFGFPDYWATPDEFLRKSGDCEDYSIIKYFALKQLGVSADAMRIVVLLDKIRGIAHAVLAVYDGNTAYILDNLSGLVLAHDFYKHYVPQYSVNESYRWAHIPLGKKAGRK